MDPPAPRGDQFRPWWREHVGILAAGASIALTAVMISSTAAYDPTLAMAIVQATGAQNIIAGGLVAQLPGVPLVVGMVCTLLAVQPGRKVGRSSLLLAGMAAALAALIVTPAWLLLLGLVPIASSTAAAFFAPARVRPSNAFLVWAFVLPAVPVSLLVPVEFLPLETVRTTGQPQVVGYVLDQTDRELVLLQYDPRRIRRYPAEQVVARHYCQRSGTPFLGIIQELDRPLLSYGVELAPLPPCPTGPGSP